MKILISRTDGLGDLCLTLPVLGWLREQLPQATLQMLVQPYAGDLARRCAWADQVFEWKDRTPQGTVELLREAAPDHILHVFPQRVIAKAAKVACIPVRSGVRGRLFHWLNCNQLLSLSRSKSRSHEAFLNLKLAALALGLPPPEPEALFRNAVPWSGYRPVESPAAKPFVLLHPLSHGNGREWPMASFARLAHLLVDAGLGVVVGGGGAEAERMAPFRSAFPEAVQWEAGCYTLGEYIGRIEQSSAVVASGTGPLHIAGLAGVHAIGLFPPKWPVNSQRWAPLGAKVRIFETEGDCRDTCSNGNCACMSAIMPESVAQAVVDAISHDF